MTTGFRSRVLATMGCAHECIAYSSQKIMFHEATSSGGAKVLCLPWASKYHEHYFGCTNGIVMCVIMALSRLGLINDLIVREIIPYMFEVRLGLSQYIFYQVPGPDNVDAKNSICVVVADDGYGFSYGSLQSIDDLICYAAYSIGRTPDINTWLRFPHQNAFSYSRAISSVKCPTRVETFTKIIVPLDLFAGRVFAADDIELIADNSANGFRYWEADADTYTRC